MLIEELMVPDVALLSPDDDVRSAAEAMAETDTQVVLVGTREAIAGILTERDILIRVVAPGLVPAETPVAQVMSSSIFCCTAREDVEAAAALFDEHKVDQLPVLDADGALVGIVTRAAIERARAGGVAA